MPQKAPVTDEEVISHLAKRRSDADPLQALPTHFDLRITTSKTLFALCAIARRTQIGTVREIIRRSKRDDVKKKRAAYNLSRKETRSEYNKARSRNPITCAKKRAAGIAYFMANKPKVYAYRKHRRQTDHQFKIGCNLRTYIYQRVGAKNTTSQSRFREVVGCSIDVFCQWLEAHFEPWMTWSNYGQGDGKWSIDHTRPCASFDLTNYDQVKECFHYSNMLPMCWRKNLEKRDNPAESFFASVVA